MDLIFLIKINTETKYERSEAKYLRLGEIDNIVNDADTDAFDVDEPGSSVVMHLSIPIDSINSMVYYIDSFQWFWFYWLNE